MVPVGAAPYILSEKSFLNYHKMELKVQMISVAGSVFNNVVFAILNMLLTVSSFFWNCNKPHEIEIR